tara:strand:+ start:200 stop:502 length:303 start_codon:yes stop_codon:yes gene_type:complete
MGLIKTILNAVWRGVKFVVMTPFARQIAMSEVEKIIKKTETKKDDEYIGQVLDVIERLEKYIPKTKKERAFNDVTRSNSNKFKIGTSDDGQLNFNLEFEL